jgi:Methyltransferase domain
LTTSGGVEQVRAAPGVEGVNVSWRHQLFQLRMAVSAARYLPRLPRALLEELFPGIGDLTISIRHQVLGRALMHGEAFVLSLITAYNRPKRIFEIGTGSGQGTLLMARQAPGARIDTLDLGPAEPSLGIQKDEPPLRDPDVIGSAYRGTEHEAAITQHLGDSSSFDYGPFRGEMDLVFVDGAHTYEYVKADSSTALSLIGEDGVVVWDDCNLVCPGVSRALVELQREGKPIYRVHGTRLAVMRASTKIGDHG